MEGDSIYLPLGVSLPIMLSNQAVLVNEKLIHRCCRLLTGSAAAQSHPEKQYLMAELVRFGFSIALEYVEDFKRMGYP